MLIPLILFCVIITKIFQFLKKRYKFWSERGVLQEFDVPPFGINWKTISGRASIVDTYQYVYEKFPDARYLGVFDFTTPVLLVRSPHLITQMCIKDFDHFMDRRTVLPDDTDPLFNKNLAYLHGKKWKEMRSTLSPTFTSSKMKTMFILMQQCANNFVEHFLHQNEELVEVELKETFSRYTNDVIASTAFGFQCDSFKERNNEFYMKGLQTTKLSGFWKNVKFSLVRVFPWLSKLVKVRVYDETFLRFFRAVIKESVEYRDKHKVDRPDMITLLMQARLGTEKTEDTNTNEGSNYSAVEEYNLGSHKKKFDFTLDDLTAQALLFFFAGFGTSSSLLTFLSYELAVNPEVQEKLIGEIDEFKKKNEILSYEGLGKLSYLDMTLSEALRKWPPFCRTDRQCTKPYMIKPECSEEKPLLVPEGITFWIPMHAIHHDKKYWPNPQKFDPERFSSENKHKIVPGSYLPFGIGPRNCIASRFVLLEAKTVIYNILSNFEIVPVEKSIIPCVPDRNSSAIIPGVECWFGLKKRKAATF